METKLFGYFLLQVLLVSPVLGYCTGSSNGYGYYEEICVSDGLLIGAAILVIVLPILVGVGLCFCCAWCCFRGRRATNKGQVFAPTQVVSTIPQPPQYQQQPPTMIYQQGSGPNAQPVTYYQAQPPQQYPPEQIYPVQNQPPQQYPPEQINPVQDQPPQQYPPEQICPVQDQA